MPIWRRRLRLERQGRQSLWSRPKMLVTQVRAGRLAPAASTTLAVAGPAFATLTIAEVDQRGGAHVLEVRAAGEALWRRPGCPPRLDDCSVAEPVPVVVDDSGPGCGLTTLRVGTVVHGLPSRNSRWSRRSGRGLLRP